QDFIERSGRAPSTPLELVRYPSVFKGEDLMRTACVRLLGMALIPTFCIFAQSKRSFEGVWQAVQVTHGPQAITIKSGPNLTIFSARHYSRIDVQTDKPRPVLANPSTASAEELRESWGPLV